MLDNITRPVIQRDDSVISDNNVTLKSQFLDVFGDLLTFYKFIIKIRTCVNIAFSVGVLLFYYQVFDSSIVSFNLNWGVLSFVIIFPMVFAISSSFQRREQALDAINNIKASLQNIFYNEMQYDWNENKKRDVEFQNSFQQNLQDINYGIVETIRDFLLMKENHSPFYFYTKCGRKIRKKQMGKSFDLSSRLIWLVKRLATTVDVLRSDGMTAPRASTLNENAWRIINYFGVLKRVKNYSTPFAMRSFSRIQIIILPIFYGPQFVNIAHTSHIAIAILFNIFTMVGLAGLFNILESIESPFDEEGMDDIRTLSETIQFKNDINLILVKSDANKTYEQQLYDEKKAEVKDIRIRKRKFCKIHKKEYADSKKSEDSDPPKEICFHEYINDNGKQVQKTGDEYDTKVNKINSFARHMLERHIIIDTNKHNTHINTNLANNDELDSFECRDSKGDFDKALKLIINTDISLDNFN